jgi:hypothetical protein
MTEKISTYPEYMKPLLRIWWRDINDPVKAAWSEEGVVQSVRVVGSAAHQQTRHEV